MSIAIAGLIAALIFTVFCFCCVMGDLAELDKKYNLAKRKLRDKEALIKAIKKEIKTHE